MNPFQIKRDIPGVDPEVIFEIGGFPVTNSFLMIILIIALLAVFSYIATRRFRLEPGKFQAGVESLYESIVEFIGQIVGSKKHIAFILPLVAAIFIYLGVANMIGFVPGLTSITYEGSSVFRLPAADFNTTFGLALAMLILIQLRSIKDWGFFKYLGKFFQFKKVYEGFKQGIGKGFGAIIEFFVGLLDIIAEIAKVISLSLRLFGNIYAGEVLAVITVGALAYILPATWMSLNILFSLIQAMVFGSLVAAYYMVAMKPEDENTE